MAIDYKDYYKILGVPKTATEQEIKSAYRKLARQHHPDVNAGDKSAEDKFKDVGEAYDVLGDADKRSKYDQYGDQWKAFGQGGPSGGGGGAYQGDVNFGGFGTGGLDDFLSSLFGGAAGGGAPSGFGGFSQPAGRMRQAPRQVREDVEYPVEISLEEAFSGTTKSFTLSVPDTCGRCGGSGAVSSGKSKPCSMCAGTGKVKGNRGLFANNVCPQCGGSGQEVEVCPECHGDGNVIKKRRLTDIKIPAGVPDGQRIRLSGQGGNGGDLYLKVIVRANAQYERQGIDLYTDFILPYTIAALGGEAPVETLSGRKVLNVPAGTQTGQTFRMGGLGMPDIKKKGTSGALFARAKISVPKDLSDRERELLTELAKLRKDSIKV
ncbi:MAG: J domain-containing protein [Capsulimonas sp.]|uniref:J domain-containing protein n=1 Tax=Capsulimonas sp. TaxID=2494211 RepID=UPI0032651D6C